MLRGLVFGACLLAGGVASAQQEQTLADIKQNLAVLTVELRNLRSELNTTGGPGVAVGGAPLDRIDAIESELQRMTAKVEQLEFRIGQVVQDGANRIGDLQFRICELEPGCDIANVGRADPLGGDAVPRPKAAVLAPDPATDVLPFQGQLAVSEEADYRAALDAFQQGDTAGASLLFEQFRDNYPGSPLTAAALVGEGQALSAQGDTREAARRFLNAYSNFPDSQVAPEALFRLGRALGALGSRREACITLAEVARRYPGSAAVADAEGSLADLGCQ